MSVAGGLSIDRPAQIQRFDDTARRELEVFADRVREILSWSILPVPNVSTVNGNRIGNADRISELDFDTIRQTRRDDVLGDVPRHVAGRAIDLRRILAGECAATMTAHAAVGIDDDFASGQSAVALRSADDESAGRIDVIFGFRVQQFWQEASA